MTEFKEPKKEEKSELKKELILILLQEHKGRRESIYSILKELKRKVEEASGGMDEGDDIEVSISIDHFNSVMESSIKNDGNIVKLIELLLKYDYSGDGSELEEVKKYQTALSENELNVTFEDE